MELDDLVGDWTIELNDSRHWEGSVYGSMTIAWLEGGGYLVQRATVDLPEVPNSIAVMGPREGSGELVQHYFDSRGVARVYEMSLDGREWRLWRDAPEFDQRFAGTFSPDGRTFHGAWEMAEDHETYLKDFDVVYTRAG